MVSSMEIIIPIITVANTLWHQKSSWNGSLKAGESLSSTAGQRGGFEPREGEKAQRFSQEKWHFALCTHVESHFVFDINQK